MPRKSQTTIQIYFSDKEKKIVREYRELCEYYEFNLGRSLIRDFFHGWRLYLIESGEEAARPGMFPQFRVVFGPVDQVPHGECRELVNLITPGKDPGNSGK